MRLNMWDVHLSLWDAKGKVACQGASGIMAYHGVPVCWENTYNTNDWR